jgi:glucose-1-phosphate thymidylyltransferase
LIIQPSVVADDAVLEGSIVGPYASIGAGAIVRDSIVRDAIVDSGANIESVIIEHSVVGRGASVNGRPVEIQIGDNSVTKW